jgi:DNA-binding Lrp family transcriptional regulator
MDELDIRICQMLGADPRLPYREIADRLGMTVSAVYNRVQAMEKNGIITDYGANISIGYLGGVPVLISGRSMAANVENVIAALGKGDRVPYILWAASRMIYVQCFLRSVTELEDQVKFVKEACQLTEARVGIESVGVMGAVRQTRAAPGDDELTHLDYRIVKAMSKDCRRPVQDIAQEVGVSARTVTRRLERMRNINALEMTIGWNPYKAEDILITMVEITLKEEADKERFIGTLWQRFGPRMFISASYSNLPSFVLCVCWTSTIGQLRDTLKELEDDPSVVSAVPNIGLASHTFRTWRDAVLEQRARK